MAWLYWNPPREAFTIPWIDRPVVWYGVLFVMGFILGYFVIIPILSHFLRQTKRLSLLDITHWPLLVDQFHASPSSPLVQLCLNYLNPQARKQLEKLSSHAMIDMKLKSDLMAALNQALQEGAVSREELEQAFGGAIATVKQTSYFLADRLCWFIVVGTLIGARLGAVFFYDWAYFKHHPIEIFQVWKGGLASHGGVAGVMLALYLYMLYVRKWISSLTFLKLLDFVAIPSALAACFIRLGNFMNQEILGTPSSMPWAVIFGQPADGSSPTPRHPVQLYEAIAYLLIFFFLYGLWRKHKDSLSPGTLVGSLFILLFSSRFILEFWKATLDSILKPSSLQMGQLLSIPFILLGFALVLWGCQKRRHDGHKDLTRPGRP